ncbi:hypothetical protein DAETH_13350 [Deinococcus aetherius]|uniref:Death domain-containing protein n=1 Tax=Deinococcus aetherius TaxID=200252 RepID=A0ABN6RI33_9DEIO|nr:hypothetical protein [Deinococcus aetherius]BDP41366.1 hypothetical protein DAETH_13350 [Deinococcus aetherius]
MSGDWASLTEYRAALEFVWALETLAHFIPFSPFGSVEEMAAFCERLADAHAGNAAALFHLWLRWVAEGNWRSEPLAWLLVNLLLRHPIEGEAALSTVCHGVSRMGAERLRRQFGED